MTKHWAIFIDNNSNKTKFIQDTLGGKATEKLSFLNELKGALFSKHAVRKLMDFEDRHDTKTITAKTTQSLKSMSSGEQKKALLNHLLKQDIDYLLLDNPFDNLDVSSQINLSKTLRQKSALTLLIQIISRKSDLLPFISNYGYLKEEHLLFYDNLNDLPSTNAIEGYLEKIPEAIQPIHYSEESLIHLNGVTVKYVDKIVLKNIEWEIKKGEFWQLIGNNGSGKTTILSMLTGENPKGYGQELFLFGKKKGSGESIWDIKKNIGYFTPSMTDKFGGYHSIEHMLISGINDSVGLYTRPSEAQLRLAKDWLKLLNLWSKKDTLFNELSMGQQRLIMTTRAMIKHPLLLILDEPTAGLDDASAQLLVSLVNKIARESDTATVFVSHRKEAGLKPDKIYQLEMSPSGSTGRIL